MALRRSNYEDYDYRDFWEEDKRAYEDRSERIALRKFFKRIKGRDKLLIDVGCGFARLFNEYSDFERIILVDYSIKNLTNARDLIKKFIKGDDKKLSRIKFVAADAGSLPFKSNAADVVFTVRLIHHLNKPEYYFDEVKRVLKSKSNYILEFANKRNYKNIIKFITGRIKTSPFNIKPYQIGDTIQNYHPKHISSALTERDFKIKGKISVSNFRSQGLKKIFGLKFLIALEKLNQRLSFLFLFGPSIFLLSEYYPDEEIPQIDIKDFEQILTCPSCKGDKLDFSSGKIVCRSCKIEYRVTDNIYDLRIKDK